jgi:predicted PurR-regulated permease PerM
MDSTDSQPLKFSVDKLFAWSVVLALALVFLIFGAVFLIPLTIAIFIWSLLSALTKFLERLSLGGRSLPHWAAQTLAIIIVIGANVTAYDLVAGQAGALEAAAPIYQENFSQMMASAAEALGLEELPTTGLLLDTLDIGSVLSWLGTSLGSGITNLILILIYVGFLLAEQRQIPLKLSRLLPDETDAARLRALASDVSLQVQRYIWMKSAISLVTGLLSYAILKLIGVDFAAIWALLIFLLNFIPNIGSLLGVVLPALLTLVQFDTYTPFLMVALGLGATQFVMGNVVEPAYMGKSLNLSPFMIVLSLTFWGLIWGIPGMFLSVPIMVVFAIVCSHFDELRWIAVLLSTDGRLMASPSRDS